MKYFANTVDIPQKHEIGLRILARKVILMGMQEEKALIPIFAYHFEHYYRIFFKVKKGKTEASKMFNLVNKEYVFCKQCGFSTINNDRLNLCHHCSSKLEFIGPCFSGNLQDKKLLEQMLKENDFNEENKKDFDKNIFQSRKNIHKLLISLIEESKINVVGFFDSHTLCEKNKDIKEIPKISFLIESLHKKGFLACQSANLLTGIKTNASFEEFLKLFY
jgi:tRNA (guanine26-N2/guanine27-N2)-dimethyltransferase